MTTLTQSPRSSKKRLAKCKALALSLTSLFACGSHSIAAETLPALNLTLENTTVSGLSSGGYMATQFHLAHSDWVTGIGVIGAGPYFCAQGDIGIALSQCVSKMEPPIEVDALSQQATLYEDAGVIAPLEHLAGSKVWILHGTADTTVNRGAADALVAQYTQWAGEEHVRYVNDKPFAHHFPTEQNGTQCDQSAAPFIGACDYDAAGALLTHIRGPLADKPTQSSGKLYRFDQQALGKEAASSLADEGVVYVPTECEQDNASGSCELHISFHGCNQYMGAVGDAYATQTGLNAWADTNQMVVLYPQTKKSLFMPLNPQGCWDWWGYTDENYANKNGPQIIAVENMARALAANSFKEKSQ
ncbi:extracellular catalytic domain type 2 short-chain-length polyhydroxyalkanoate depolymerase [Alteromonas oceanisediminis]|uniref:extracellular catalytic domain type 2 short-chain-length polyhydroxyalkanoate depolymerase n=1 Tax=Alteromonas oceanisediminis TaxID=2836180 RepID=UPI001BDA3299|nr:PHB depolymerase family esterase [Alteromonas oceanisediminis]MBT0588071.1 polyhydroxybutyrate depolymerase [Alteromonas oceanisediminis]